MLISMLVRDSMAINVNLLSSHVSPVYESRQLQVLGALHVPPLLQFGSHRAIWNKYTIITTDSKSYIMTAIAYVFHNVHLYIPRIYKHL